MLHKSSPRAAEEITHSRTPPLFFFGGYSVILTG
jgi:hypothetical protein